MGTDLCPGGGLLDPLIPAFAFGHPGCRIVQFSLPVNVELSLYGIHFLKQRLRELCEGLASLVALVVRQQSGGRLQGGARKAFAGSMRAKCLFTGLVEATVNGFSA